MSFINIKKFKMKEEFSKYDKVVYGGEIFEVLETADNTGMMKIEPLFDDTYKFIWVDEEMVVSLSRAIKLRLVDDETADEAMNFGKPKIGDAVVESGPLVGEDGSGKDEQQQYQQHLSFGAARTTWPTVSLGGTSFLWLR